LITKKLVEQIEGEALVSFDMDGSKVSYATVAFPHFRGMESILEHKHPLDALVYTPRVCGICGHAHLMATVRALEDVYTNAGVEVVVSQKAKNIREFTLLMESIQNHLKWIYMVVLPELQHLTKNGVKKMPLKGAFSASIASKAIAVFAGQWPHASYMLPGGITSDPTYIEVMQARNYLDELIRFVEKETFGVEIEHFIAMQSCKDFRGLLSDAAQIERHLLALEMEQKGFGYDRFLILGEHSFSTSAKIKGTRIVGADAKYVTTTMGYAPDEQTFAYNALYKDEYFETGPLARMMAGSHQLVKNIHRRFKDSAYSRVIARIYEVGIHLQHAKKLLDEIDVTQPSVNELPNITKLSGVGVGIVEAPRGPLIHKISIENGHIANYKITTPTQFNIGSDTPNKLTPVQHAMKGLTQQEALFVFRTFDVCSVCTTH